MQKLLMAMLALALLTGCSSEATKPAEATKPQPKPPEIVTARTAFQKLYISAHGWGRVTPAMLDTIFARARAAADLEGPAAVTWR